MHMQCVQWVHLCMRMVMQVLAERYPAMFKPSHSCRSPHVNVDVLRAEMHRVGVLSKHAIGAH